MTARTLRFTSGDVALEGTLQLGSGSGSGSGSGAARSALLLSGSGPVDRDSDARRLPTGVMREVAAHLADVGIASFRYDKRGVGQSGGDHRAAGLFDNVDDARAALAALRDQPEVAADGVVLVGHSEGALLAAEVAATDERVAGVVLLAGQSSPGEQVLVEQLEAVAGTIPAPVRWLLRVLRRDLRRTQARRLERLRASTGDTVRLQGVRVNGRWFREFLDHDPAPSLRALRCPVLVVGGGKDLQVAPHHARRVGELVGDRATVVVVPDLSHLLRREDGEPDVRAYRRQVREPVLGEVLDRVAAFVASA